MSEIILGKYKHFKGGEYEVIGTAVDSENLGVLVIYKQLYPDPEFKEGTLWVRPITNFTEYVDIAGKKVPRFKLIK